MIPNEVFHYTKKETALEKILFDRQIRLGQIGLTNDPRETKMRHWSFMYFLSPSSSDLSSDQAAEIWKEVYVVSINEWKVFCVSQHPHDYIENVASPLLRGDCRPRMWATYAENHKGICLKLNGKKFDQRLRDELGDKCKIFCGSVIYDDLKSTQPPEPIVLQEGTKVDSKKLVRDYCMEHWEELFLQKSRDWETEFEYRWLVYSSRNSPEYVSVDGVVEGVLVGEDFPRDYRPSLIELCKKLKIPAGIIEWRNGVPNPQYKKIYKP